MVPATRGLPSTVRAQYPTAPAYTGSQNLVPDHSLRPYDQDYSTIQPASLMHGAIQPTQLAHGAVQPVPLTHGAVQPVPLTHGAVQPVPLTHGAAHGAGRPYMQRSDHLGRSFSTDETALNKQILATHAADFEDLNVRPILAIVEEILSLGRPLSIDPTKVMSQNITPHIPSK